MDEKFQGTEDEKKRAKQKYWEQETTKALLRGVEYAKKRYIEHIVAFERIRFKISWDCPTMGVTQGLVMSYNPAFLKKLMLERNEDGKLILNSHKVESVLAHEVYHFRLRHHKREKAHRLFKTMTHDSFNVAMDAEINSFLQDDDPWIKKTGITPELMKWPRGKSMEEYIEMLYRDMQKQMQDYPERYSDSPNPEKKQQPQNGPGMPRPPMPGGSQNGQHQQNGSGGGTGAQCDDNDGRGPKGNASGSGSSESDAEPDNGSCNPGSGRGNSRAQSDASSGNGNGVPSPVPTQQGCGRNSSQRQEGTDNGRGGMDADPDCRNGSGSGSGSNQSDDGSENGSRSGGKGEENNSQDESQGSGERTLEDVLNDYPKEWGSREKIIDGLIRQKQIEELFDSLDLSGATEANMDAEKLNQETQRRLEEMNGQGSKHEYGLIDANIQKIVYPWQEVLKNVVCSVSDQKAWGYENMSYRKPNNRWAGVCEDIIFPIYYSREERFNLVVAVDVSGSMYKIVEEMYARLKSLSEVLSDEAHVTLLEADTQVSRIVEDFETDVSVDQIGAGGGTDMGCVGVWVMDQIKHHGREMPDLIIVMTDNETGWNPVIPELFDRTVVLTTHVSRSCPYKQHEVKI